MSAVGLALWRARSHPLELVRLEEGGARKSVFRLQSSQLVSAAPWLQSVYPSDRKRAGTFLQSRKIGRVPRFVDYRLIVGEGEPLWVRHWLLARSPARAGRRDLTGVLLAIPEQKHLEWECLRVSERECHRIGQELHDDLSQVLTGLTCMAQSLCRRAARPDRTFARDLRELGGELSAATRRVRAMAHGLFPAQLDYLTLRHALHEFARQTKVRFPLRFTVQFSGRIPPHSPDQILHIYRIVQEAVGNAVRHGKATAIRIFVAAGKQRMRVRIEDNGAGFPNLAVRPEGIGMHVMQYRARMLVGSLRFKNISRHGAVVELEYPLEAAPLRPRTQPALS